MKFTTLKPNFKKLLKAEKYMGWDIYTNKTSLSAGYPLYDVTMKKGSAIKSFRQAGNEGQTKQDIINSAKAQIEFLERHNEMDDISPEGRNEYFYDGTKFRVEQIYDFDTRKHTDWTVDVGSAGMVSISNLLKGNPIREKTKIGAVREFKKRWKKWKKYVQIENKTNISNNTWPYRLNNYELRE